MFLPRKRAGESAWMGDRRLRSHVSIVPHGAAVGSDTTESGGWWLAVGVVSCDR